MSEPVVVTDHAVVRYLERVRGFNIENVRAAILTIAGGAAAVGAKAVRKDGFCYQIRDRKIVTVSPDGPRKR